MTRLLVAVLLSGCFGTETGNPPYAPASMGLTTSDPAIASLAPNDAGPEIVEAQIAIATLHAIEGAACDRLASDPWLRDLSGDLAQGIAADLPAGAWCGFHLALAEPLVVRGTTLGGTPFELTSSSIEHGVDVRGDLVLSEDESVIVAFDVAAWLRGVDLAQPPDADGVIRISSAAFDLGFARSIEVYADPNGDGVLGPGEHDAGPIAHSH